MNKIYPVLVLYKCRLNDSRSYTSLIKPLGIEHFLIYDNSPADFEQSTEGLPAAADYIRDEQNSVLPKAYNTAAKIAEQKGFTHLLILDQDTNFQIEMWKEMQACQASVCCPRLLINKNNGMRTPIHLRLHQRYENMHEGFYPLDKYKPINSGLCVSLEAFRAAGGYRGSIRLDWADHQFTEDLLRAGIKEVYVLNACGEQELFNVVHRYRRAAGEPQAEKAIYTRFAFYCLDYRAFTAYSIRAKFIMFYHFVRHTIGVVMRTRSLRAFGILIKNYFRCSSNNNKNTSS